MRLLFITNKFLVTRISNPLQYDTVWCGYSSRSPDDVYTPQFWNARRIDRQRDNRDNLTNGTRPLHIERRARLNWRIYHRAAAAIVSRAQTLENSPVDTRASVNLPSSGSGSGNNGIRRRFHPLLVRKLSFQFPARPLFCLFTFGFSSRILYSSVRLFCLIHLARRTV